MIASVSVKSEPGPPITLGGAAAAQVRLIVWCEGCGHQDEPDPAEMAARYGAETPVLDWRKRLVCSKCKPLCGLSARPRVRKGFLDEPRSFFASKSLELAESVYNDGVNLVRLRACWYAPTRASDAF